MKQKEKPICPNCFDKKDKVVELSNRKNKLRCMFCSYEWMYN